MAQKHRYHNNRQKNRSAPHSPVIREAPVPHEKKAPVIYGKPFVLLEDTEKKTFEFKAGAWVQHSTSIAEYKQDSQVKQLDQKVNNMYRYEIRSPLPTGA